MGTDMYMRVEIMENGKWVMMPFEPILDRHYGLYAFLANVRNDSEIRYISSPRGLPDDMSEGVRLAYENDDLGTRSFSYLTVEQLLDWPWSKEFSPGLLWVEFVGHKFIAILKWLSRWTQRPDQVRLVFGFSS
jgi:hypothetical protein